MHATIRRYEGVDIERTDELTRKGKRGGRMTNFLHWRKMTWALLLWCAAMCAWPLISSVEATRVAVLWFVGAIAFGLLWLATQPLFRRGHGLRSFFVMPGPGHWRVANLHRTYWTADDRPDLMERGTP